MPKAISTVIAALLMLIITIALAGFAYTYISGTFSSKTAQTFSVVDTFNNTVTIINDGTEVITSFQRVTIDGSQANFMFTLDNPSLTTYAPNANGFIADWLILGGFSESNCVCSGTGSCNSFIDENNAMPFSGLSQSGLTWFEQHGLIAGCNTPNGIDLDSVIEPGISNTNIVSYAFAYVYSPIKRNAKLKVGSDDGIKVWLNGNLVHDNPRACRCWVTDSDVITVNLEQGWNKLLLRIGQGGGAWGFVTRFTDTSDNPLTDLKIALKQQINPGQTTTIKLYTQLSQGTHTLRLCTASMCTTALLTII